MRMTPDQRRIVRNAVARVNNAIKAGRLVRKPCEWCGYAYGEAHHRNGYGKDHALDVVWLCGVHHRAEHDAWKIAPWLMPHGRFDDGILPEPYNVMAMSDDLAKWIAKQKAIAAQEAVR